MPLEIMRRKRKELGLTQQGLAKRAGVSGSLINELERGRCRGHSEQIQRIAKALGVTARDIREAQDDLAAADVRKVILENNALLRPEFKPGKVYRLEHRNPGGYRNAAFLDGLVRRETLLYVDAEGKHHMFRHPIGGWRTTFTDAQLVGVKVKEG